MPLEGDLFFVVFFSFSTIQIQNSNNDNASNFYFNSNYISLAGFRQVTKVAFEKHLQVTIFLSALSIFLLQIYAGVDALYF